MPSLHTKCTQNLTIFTLETNYKTTIQVIFFTLFSNIYITSHPPLHIWICLLVNKSRKVINKCLTVAAIRLGISGRYPTPDSSLTTMK